MYEKRDENCVFQYCKFQKGHNSPQKIVANPRHSNLICSPVKQSDIIKSRGVCETLQYAPDGNKVEKAIFSFKVKV